MSSCTRNSVRCGSVADDETGRAASRLSISAASARPDSSAASAVGNGVADARPPEQVALLVGEVRQDLADQVVGDRSLVPGELVEEAVGSGAP